MSMVLKELHAPPGGRGHCRAGSREGVLCRGEEGMIQGNNEDWDDRGVMIDDAADDTANSAGMQTIMTPSGNAIAHPMMGP